MARTRATQSGLTRLVGLLKQPQHDYSPDTGIFLDLDTDQVALDLRLAEKGTARGRENMPPTDAKGFDDVENQIIERIERHKQAADKLYLDYLHTYDGRLAALNFEERFFVIQQAAPEAVGEFKAEAGLGRDDLRALRLRLRDFEVERKNFRKKHGLTRPAYISTPGKTLLKVGILAVLFVIEVVINGSFLAQSNLGGYLGGAVQAVSFAALNIVASFLCGLVAVRQIIKRNVFFKFIGFLSLLLYLVFAVLLNLTLAHLREIPPTLNADVGQLVLEQMTKQPHILHDINSWVFFGIGFIFSLIALADGILFTDPYPGYAALEKRWEEAHDNYTDTKASLVDDLRDIRDKATDAMNEASQDLSKRRGEYDSILAGRVRLASRFVEHQNHIERSANALLTVYREANRATRNSPGPAYFVTPYVMQRVSPGNVTPDTAASDKLQRAIDDTKVILARQVEAIQAAFSDAVSSYREVDEMFPGA